MVLAGAVGTVADAAAFLAGIRRTDDEGRVRSLTLARVIGDGHEILDRHAPAPTEGQGMVTLWIEGGPA